VHRCAAVCDCMCGSAHGSVRAMRAAVCGSVFGTAVWQCGSACLAVRQCAAAVTCVAVCCSMRGSVRSSVSQCVAVCGSARRSVW
jgi:hypothetical protein